MTLTVYENLEQGSEPWLLARAGIVTASVVGQLVTAKTLKPANNDTARGLIATLVAERITNHVEQVYPNRDMQRGTLDEPYARDLYAEHHAPVQEVGFMVRNVESGNLGYSPDGLIGDHGLIEIKSRNQKAQLRTILDDAVPLANVAQLQCGLLVSGRDWIDYVSYCGGMPLYVKRVEPDPRWHVAILEAVETVELAALEMIGRYKAATKDAPIAERIDHFPEMEF